MNTSNKRIPYIKLELSHFNGSMISVDTTIQMVMITFK